MMLLILDMVAGEELIKFICYDNWTISSDVSWITFGGPTEGSGNAIIKIHIEKNTSEGIVQESSLLLVEVT